nr:MAG TPA: hypothetical protein [Caudoviricetes sp.]
MRDWKTSLIYRLLSRHQNDIIVCITAGHCAKFCYEGLEDLTDLQAVKPPSERHHRLHLCFWFVSKKPHNRIRKLSKSTLHTSGACWVRNELPVMYSLIGCLSWLGQQLPEFGNRVLVLWNL